MNGDLFVTGTDTGVGKTLLSALLVAALNKTYWKPVQTGAREGTDRETVIKWAGVAEWRTCPESYVFEPPVSPHLAAEQAGTDIELSHIRRPPIADGLIIEGAGGILTPINQDAFMLDLILQLGAPAVIASRTVLGTINHTLLTLATLRNARIEVRGVVMIGTDSPDNRRAIERFGKVSVIGSIPWLDTIDRQTLLAVFQQRFDTGAFV